MIKEILTKSTIKAINQLYGETVDGKLIQVQKTRPEFEEDFTIVVFPFFKDFQKGTGANSLRNWKMVRRQC